MPRGFENIPSGSDLPERLTRLTVALAKKLETHRRVECRGGRYDPLGAGQIVRYFLDFHHEKITDVDVRAMVNHLRRMRYPIGSGAKGYFFALTKAELADTLGQLTDRIQGIQAAIDGLNGSFSAAEELLV